MPEAHSLTLHVLIIDLVTLNILLVNPIIHLVALFAILDPFSLVLLALEKIEKIY